MGLVSNAFARSKLLDLFPKYPEGTTTEVAVVSQVLLAAINENDPIESEVTDR